MPGLPARGGNSTPYGNMVKLKNMIGATNGYDTLLETPLKISQNMSKVSLWGKWYRGGLPWTEIEPNSVAGNRPNGYNFTKGDTWINAAIAAGLNVVLNLGTYTPDWARSGHGGLGGVLGMISTANPPDTAHETDWQDYVYYTSKRYMALGVRYFEIWNEPNLSNFWKIGPDPVRFATLLKLAYDKVMQAATELGVTAYVITGGLAPASNPNNWRADITYTPNNVNGTADSVMSGGVYYTAVAQGINHPPPNATYWRVGGKRPPYTFMQHVYSALDTAYGAGYRPFDHVGHHPYPPIDAGRAVLLNSQGGGYDWDNNPSSNAFWSGTRELRKVILNNETSVRAKTVKIIATEAGIPSFTYTTPYNTATTPDLALDWPTLDARQREVNLECINVWFNDFRSFVGPFIMFKLRDSQTYANNADPENWGLYRDWGHYDFGIDDKPIINSLKLEGDATYVADANFVFSQSPTAQNATTIPNTIAGIGTLPGPTVVAPPAITIGTLPHAVAGASYSQSVASWVSGGTAPYTWTTTGGLPAGFSLATDGTISSANATAVGTVNVNLRVDAASGGFATASFSFVTDASGARTGVDLARYVGTTTYTSTHYYNTSGAYVVNPLFGTAVDPVANRTAITSNGSTGAVDVCLAMSPDGEMYNSNPGVIMFGIAATRTAGTSYTYINGQTLNTWNLPGTTFRVAANQPPRSFQVGGTYSQNTSAPDTLFALTNATAPVLFFNLDGNASNQNQGTYVSGASNGGFGTVSASPTKYGWYCHGIRLNTCGATTAVVRSDNIRGVASSSGLDSNGVARTESFNFQKLGMLTGTTIPDNVIYESTTTLASQSASGAVWQSQPTTATWYLTINCFDTRHGMGCYQGGHGYIRSGSSFTRCNTAINIEAGGSNSTTSGSWIVVGDSASGEDQVIFNNNSKDIVINNNSGVNATTGLKFLASVHLFDAYGTTSTSAGRSIVFAHDSTDRPIAAESAKVYKFTNHKAITPTQYVVDYQNGSVLGRYTTFVMNGSVSTCRWSGLSAGTNVPLKCTLSEQAAITGVWTRVGVLT